MTKDLKETLDPRGVKILERRLISGEITTQVFKDILKRQMIKQFFHNSLTPLQQLKNKIFQLWYSDPKTPGIETQLPGEDYSRIEIEELFAMRQKKSI